MPLSALDLYRDVLPKTNCGECGVPAGLAFDAVRRRDGTPLTRPEQVFILIHMAQGGKAEVRLLFDETITEHLDIESIMFLGERLRQLLCDSPV